MFVSSPAAAVTSGGGGGGLCVSHETSVYLWCMSRQRACFPLIPRPTQSTNASDGILSAGETRWCRD